MIGNDRGISTIARIGLLTAVVIALAMTTVYVAGEIREETDTEPIPDTSFAIEIDDERNEATVEIEDGKPVEAGYLHISGNELAVSESKNWAELLNTNEHVRTSGFILNRDMDESETFDIGEGLVIPLDEGANDPTIHVVWESQTEDRGSILSSSGDLG